MSQGWSKIFNRINWLNRPSTNTPLNATNLNAGDSAIDKLDDRIITLDTVKADMQVVNGMVADISVNDADGIITVTYKNGSTKTYDTNLEKIATNFTYDYSTQRLVLTLSDGSKQYVDMSALITQYEFKDSTTIAFSVDSTGKVSASVKNGSITDAMLETGYLANITAQATKAESMANSATTSSNSAYDNAKLSQSYAIGGSGVRDGEDTDNSKYYSEQASKSATASANSASTASTKASEAASSASSASASATQSAMSESNARKSASSAAASASTASTKASEASNSATLASGSASSALTSATSASESAESASASATTATQKAKDASSSATSASSSASSASTSATSASKSATDAKTSANSASASATAASTSATNAKASETASATSAKNAKTSETNAASGASTATAKASAASTSASNAATSEANAKKYYEQAKAISESFSGALRPMGTVTFANLPSVGSASAGDMYNISDEFVTTSDFVEGAGITEPAGSNVYKTEAGKWDVLAGSPVTGVKGEKEKVFGRGNVNITCASIGALPADGDSQDNTVTFTSNDSLTGDSTAPALMTSGETHASIFSKVSTIFKNVRWLLSKMGTTDISAIGNGTVTGALSTLNSNKANTLRWQYTMDTYTQTTSAYVSYWTDMYRIMTHVQLLPNASTMIDKGKPIQIYALKEGDGSYMFPITIASEGSIRGLCPLNVQIEIVILWLLN